MALKSAKVVKAGSKPKAPIKHFVRERVEPITETELEAVPQSGTRSFPMFPVTEEGHLGEFLHWLQGIDGTHRESVQVNSTITLQYS